MSCLSTFLLLTLCGCSAPVIERVNFPDNTSCTDTGRKLEDAEYRAPITEQVGAKTISTCVRSPVAHLVMCARAVALASQSTELVQKTQTTVNIPEPLGGGGGAHGTEAGQKAVVINSEAAPLIQARANGLNSCRLQYEIDAGLVKQADAESRAKAERMLTTYTVCMQQLSQLNQRDGTEIKARGRMISICEKILAEATGVTADDVKPEPESRQPAVGSKSESGVPKGK